MQLTIDSSTPVVLTVQPVGAGSPPARARSSERVSGTPANVCAAHNKAPRPTYLSLGGHTIRIDADRLVSLTDIFKAAGSPKSKQPAQWLRLPSTQQIIDFARRTLNVGKSHNEILRTERGGRTPGAWAHWQIAMTYAEYISPEFQFEVNEAYRQLQAEAANPDLSIDRAHRNWQKQGKSDEWIARRISSVPIRKAFTKTLSRHGVRGDGYRDATNAIYTPLFDGTAEQIRHKRNLPATANLRDTMSRIELAAVSLAEELATEKIEQQQVRGNAPVTRVCRSASTHVAAAIRTSRAA
jgi:hypothetical protein